VYIFPSSSYVPTVLFLHAVKNSSPRVGDIGRTVNIATSSHECVCVPSDTFVLFLVMGDGAVDFGFFTEQNISYKMDLLGSICYQSISGSFHGPWWLMFDVAGGSCTTCTFQLTSKFPCT
jgi:hypothetical protein